MIQKIFQLERKFMVMSRSNIYDVMLIIVSLKKGKPIFVLILAETWL